jgi:hypothetical protein
VAPTAATESVTAVPGLTVWLAGWVVIAGIWASARGDKSRNASRQSAAAPAPFITGDRLKAFSKEIFLGSNVTGFANLL